MALTTVNRLMHALSLSWQHLDFTSVHGLVSCQGYQRLEVGSGGFLSLASRFDTSGILSQGWCRACDRQCFPSFVHVDARGLNSPRVHILVDASESKRFWVRIGELSGAGAPLDFSKSLTYTSDSFQRSGQRSVARHSVAMPSPCNKFSHARVTDGDGTGDMGEDEEDWGADGPACSSLPTLGKWLFCSPSSNADHKQAGRLTLSDAWTGPRIRACMSTPLGTGLRT